MAFFNSVFVFAFSNSYTIFVEMDMITSYITFRIKIRTNREAIFNVPVTPG